MWGARTKVPKSTQVLLFCEGVYFLARTRVGTAAARCVCVWIVGGSGRSGPGRAKFFQFIPVLHRVSVLSGTQKSSTGSNLRYTQCLDFEYPVHTGTPDPRFTGFTGYGKSRIRIPVPDLEFRWRKKKKSTCQVTKFSSTLRWSFYTAKFIGLPAICKIQI